MGADMPSNRQSPSLLDYRRGLPTPADAARFVAIITSIPAAIPGLILGALLVEPHASEGRMVLFCATFATGAAFAMLSATMLVFRLFGLRPLIFMADVMLGAYVGLMVGRVFIGWTHEIILPITIFAGIIAALVILPRPTIESPASRENNHDDNSVAAIEDGGTDNQDYP